ncbi:hypothetical protein BD779DRAFT_1672312 [Infundibulicybe gibba]|nr:hypothetical protein BD779DRAFT_1672312 [Infundibulicybe gibba]
MSDRLTPRLSSSQDYTPGDMILKPPPLTDFTERVSSFIALYLRAIKSQMCRVLSRKKRLTAFITLHVPNRMLVTLRSDKADDRIKAAILQRQLAEQRLMQADRYVGKIQSLIRWSGFTFCLNSTSTSCPSESPSIEISGDEYQISVDGVAISVLLD